MARDFGMEVDLELQTDAVAGKGMATRLGAGKIRHIATQWLWIQRVFHERLATVVKIPGKENPADAMTKHLSGVDLMRHVATLGYEYREGVSALALKAAV